ncbi:hypothetical protein BBD41_24490 [Paenibacillus ihbetae]|uniref:Uncharacterized protein n=1 Tax=Paenibacillus ihbetae TaxID=1870820 RepID=A0A1B2E683_9BACL|nr:hypothetical protein BBD41_24490 [Paenibacillus ihbetae]
MKRAADDELTGFQIIATFSESQVRATRGKNVSSQNRETADRIKLVNERPKLQAEMVAGASVADHMK